MAASAAPWRDLFVSQVAEMPMATFTLSTSHATTSTNTTPAVRGSNDREVVPRARTCVYRGLWGVLPDNDKNPAERNPHVYDSDLPVFTTDARMDKVSEMLGSGPGGSAGGRDSSSGGGGAVEAVWWAVKAQTQWRVRGTAWVLGPDIDGDQGSAAREAIGARMRSLDKRQDGDGGKSAEGQQDWSWAREVTAHFGNLSPAMRGTFRNPAPGTPRSVPGGEGEGLGQKVDDVGDALARSAFRVCVIVPSQVDQVDLSDPDKPRRWLYTYVGSAPAATRAGGEAPGLWERCELWP